MVKKKKDLNEPDIPTFNYIEQLQADNEELARALSRLRFHNLVVTEFLTESQIDTIKRYAP